MTRFSFRVAWSDLDASHRLAGASCLSYAARACRLFFDDRRQRMSGALEAVVPVITEETLYYRRPLGLHDRFSVTLTLGGLSPDAARFLIVNRLEGPDGEICAEVLARGAWMHSLRRALVTPREPAARALETLRREHAFDPFC